MTKTNCVHWTKNLLLTSVKMSYTKYLNCVFLAYITYSFLNGINGHCRSPKKRKNINSKGRDKVFNKGRVPIFLRSSGSPQTNKTCIRKSNACLNVTHIKQFLSYNYTYKYKTNNVRYNDQSMNSLLTSTLTDTWCTYQIHKCKIKANKAVKT